VKGGADYIDCPVQFTKDGVAICRESPDLLTNTDISLHSEFFPGRISTIPQLQPAKGIYTFNLTLQEIKTLKGGKLLFKERMTC
jgi:glycerophosphoryl diester phosphodiesterase